MARCAARRTVLRQAATLRCTLTAWVLALAVTIGGVVWATDPAAASGDPPLAGLSMTFHLVPVGHWDDLAGPQGHDVADGRVYLYRVGSFVPEVTGPAGEPLWIPPGDWVWTAEAPGWVSTFTQPLSVAASARAEDRSLIVPVTPACRLQQTDEAGWRRLDRVDVVSLTESAVYPLVPGGRTERWIPAGAYLSYGVRNGQLAGISPIRRCERDETLPLAVPSPPQAGRQSFVVIAELPQTAEPSAATELVAELATVSPISSAPPQGPSAATWQGRRGALFFLDLPADERRELSLRHPRLRTVREAIEPLGGSVREVNLGNLRPRRDLEVAVDYRPAREHRSARLWFRSCGLERASQPVPLLAGDCGKPQQVQSLVPGVQAYHFDALDDGQYLVEARIDDEDVPGLGQQVAPYLDPSDDREPMPGAVVRLEEMEVHGRLLIDGEPVAGQVRVVPWAGVAGVPSRAVTTEDDDEYHLFYFARYPRPGEVQHFPEPLADLPASKLPGLYCCFELSACSETGACRTYNVHSRFTGGGEMDLELPGPDGITVHVVDAVSGQPVRGARLLVPPSQAFHFYFGDVLWQDAAGAEPDALAMGDDGTVIWLPPGPGEQRLYVLADGYRPAGTQAELVPGALTSVTVELEREDSQPGTNLVFEDGSPVSGATLVAFDDEQPRPACNAAVSAHGAVEVPAECGRGLTYLLVHPRAALQTFSAQDLIQSGVLEARLRPGYPPRVRVVDADGAPLEDVFVQLRLGDLTVTPDDVLAGASAGPPFQPASNAVGEIVLYGVDAEGVEPVEVSPWLPYVENWVSLSGRSGRVVNVTAVPLP